MRLRMILTLLLVALSTPSAQAAVARVLDGATITNGAATLTLPTTTDTLMGRATTDTLTNKTLTSPVINTPTGIVKGDVGLGNVDNTSDATKNAATATLTNKTLTAPVINSPTGIVKGDVGLGNVDNTSDATKDAATATLTNKTMSGAANTFTNIPAASAITGVLPAANGGASVTANGTAGAPQAVTAGGGVSLTSPTFFNIAFIEGSAGAVTVTATPSITAGTSVGQRLVLVGKSDTNTVTLQDEAGLATSDLRLNGNWVSANYKTLELVWDGAEWDEVARR